MLSRFKKLPGIRHLRYWHHAHQMQQWRDAWHPEAPWPSTADVAWLNAIWRGEA